MSRWIIILETFLFFWGCYGGLNSSTIIYYNPYLTNAQTGIGYYLYQFPSSGVLYTYAKVFCDTLQAPYVYAKVNDCDTLGCIQDYHMREKVCVACPSCIRGLYLSSHCTWLDDGTCFWCPVGTYNPVSTLNTACLNCPTGTYSSGTGASACTACEVGKYNSMTGVSVCTSCPSGSSVGTGSTNANQCTCGQGVYSYTQIPNMCVPCRAGAYNTISGLQVSKFTAFSSGFNWPYASAFDNNLNTYFQTSGNAPYDFVRLDMTGAIMIDTIVIWDMPTVNDRYTQNGFMVFVGDTYHGSPPYDLNKNKMIYQDTTPAANRYITTVTCGFAARYVYIVSASTTASVFKIAEVSIENTNPCSTCPKGHFSSNVGVTTCQNCALGTYSSSDSLGLSTCLTCPAGSFNWNPGMTFCGQCMQGTYNATVGLGKQSLTYTCGINKNERCNIWSSSSMPAAEGIYAADFNLQSYFHSNQGALQYWAIDFSESKYVDTIVLYDRVDCPCATRENGLEIYVGNTQITSSSFAASGDVRLCYRDDHGPTERYPLHAYCGSQGRYLYIVSSASNTDNFFHFMEVAIFSEGLCSTCNAGYMAAYGASQCTPCANGTYSNTAGAGVCDTCRTKCGTGSYQIVPCTSTQDMSCAPCTQCDFYVISPCTTNHDVVCSYQPYGGVGQVQKHYGYCVLDYLQLDYGRMNVYCYTTDRYTLRCMANNMQSCLDKTGKFCYQCVTEIYWCNIMSWPLRYLNKNDCYTVGCDAGSFLANYSAPKIKNCVGCNIGYYSTTWDASGCTICPIGTYSSASGQSSCTQCAPGYYSATPGVSMCLACGNGFYGTSSGMTVCTMCDSGTYTSSTGLTTCTTCSGGTTLCFFCSAGTYRTYASGGGLTCNACSAGTYNTGVNMLACLLCQPGTFSARVSVTTCDKCDSGKFSTGSGIWTSATCVSCGAGTFFTGTAASECQACTAGTYSTGTGRNQACDNCLVGSYSTRLGLSSSAQCTLCAPGNYTDTTGQTMCKTCTPGTFNWNSGMSFCGKCSLGTYNNVSGMGVISLNINSVWASSTYSTSIYQPLSAVDRQLGTFFHSDLGNSQYLGLYLGSSQSVTQVIFYDRYDGFRSRENFLSVFVGSESVTANAYTFPFANKYCFRLDDNTNARYPQVLYCRGQGAYVYFVGGIVSSYLNIDEVAVTSSTVCDYCPPGTYSGQAATVCVLCAAGSYSTGYASSACSTCTYTANMQITGATSMDICFSCTAGSYVSGNLQCSQCPSGAYSTGTYTSSCSTCGIGKYYTGTGATSSSVCVGCPGGNFNWLDGMSSCAACPMGSYNGASGYWSNNLIFTCVGNLRSQCLVWTGTQVDQFPPKNAIDGIIQGNAYFSSGTGDYQYWAVDFGLVVYIHTILFYDRSDTTQRATQNNFRVYIGNTSVPAVSQQYTFPLGNVMCYQDPPSNTNRFPVVILCQQTGRYLYIVSNYQNSILSFQEIAVFADTPCIGCSLGKYSTSTGAILSSVCTACAAGTYSGSSRTACTTCFQSTYTSSSGFTACLACPTSTYTSFLGATSINQCAGCAAGLFDQAGSCVACTAGTYTSTTGRSACSLCSAGSYSTMASKTQSTCNFCITGTFSTASGASSSNVCTACGTGRYTSAPGKSSCDFCVAGTYSQTLGRSLPCDACIAGTYSTVQGATSSSVCIGCATGYFSSANGATVCTACPIGTYNGGSVCTTCPNGQYNTKTASSACDLCGLGMYSDVGTSTCRACSSGTYAYASGIPSCPQCSQCDVHARYLGTCTTTNNTISCQCLAGYEGNGYRCTQCNIGYYRQSCAQFGNCIPCPVGFYTTGMGSTACNLCPIGTYSTGTGMKSLRECTLCSIGSYNGNEGMAYCVSCGSGSYSTTLGATSSSVCQNCLPGSYKNSDAATDPCIACAAGTYSTASGAYTSSNCQSCQVGKYSTASGVTTCLNCYTGTYNSLLGVTTCTACSINQYSTSLGATSAGACITCAASSYTVSTAQSTCILCTAGKYATGVGYCSSCIVGTYNTGNGFTACIGCATGTYNTGTGMTSSSSCSNCGAGTYGPTSGVSVCTQCPTGTYSTSLGASSISTCVSCSTGTYNSLMGVTTCTTCSINQYSTSLGATSAGTCNTCPPASYTVSTAQSTCILCTAGKYATGVGYCSSCIVGTYNTGNGFTICQSCAAGTYSTSLGASSISTCIACVAGTYSTASGASVCVNCGVGKYSVTTGASLESSCVVCTAGKYGSITGATGCISCPTGTYSTSTAADSLARCLNCIAGRYSTGTAVASSSGCILCGAGTYNTGQGSTDNTYCRTCGAGTYSTTSGAISSATCIGCIAGTYSTATTGASSSVCVACVAGTYHTGTGGTSSSVCISCGAGTYSTGTGITAITGCIGCGVGTFSTGTGGTSSSACISCGAGKYSTGTGITAITGCIGCAPGTYNTASVSSTCIQCTTGKYSTASGATSVLICTDCANGTYTSLSGATTCVLCSICATQGYYTNYCNAGSTSDSVSCACLQGYTGNGWVCTGCNLGYIKSTCTGACVACSSGTFMSSTGASACTTCNPGTYSTSTGLTSANQCQSCTQGKYSTSTGATSISQCISCVAGTYSTSVGANSVDTCLTCGSGSFSSGIGMSTCFQCPAGTYSTMLGISSSGQCSLCQSGSYSSGLGVTVCSLCAAGTFSSITGLTDITQCTSCDTGTYSTGLGVTTCITCTACNTNSAILSDCAAGSTSDTRTCTCNTGYSGNGFTCTACNPGYYKSITGTSVCVACTAGKYSTDYAASTCWLCNAGTYFTGTGLMGPQQCLDCPVGTYTTASGDIACFNCQTGKFSTQPAASSASFCQSCAAGAFSTNIASTTCTNCTAGMFSTAIGMTVSTCTTCAAGSYNSGVGISTCVLCTAGKYSTAIGTTTSATCVNCGAGTYFTGSGAAICVNCAAGTYSTVVGGTNIAVCSTCTAGKYSTATAAQSCVSCIAGTYFTGTGGTTSSVCITCTAGTYSSVVGSGGACVACVAGKYYSGTGGASSSVCTACQAGTYGNITGASACVACVSGTYSTILGATSSAVCTTCGAGTYSTSGGACVSCATGTYSTAVLATSVNTCSQCNGGYYNSITGASVCTPCTAGKYSTAMGAISSSICLNCTSGSFSQTGGLACASCSACDKNAYYTSTCTTLGADTTTCACLPGYSGNGWSCTACTPGYYQPVCNGPCLLCTSGTYTSGMALTACSYCNIGTYSTSIGLTSIQKCEACRPGTYITGTGFSQCSACTSGTYNTNYGGTLCASCSSGTYFTGTGGLSSAVCVTCEAGKYNPYTGVSACILCDSGTYRSTTGGTSVAQCLACNTCPANSINTTYCTPGSTSATIQCTCISGFQSSGTSCTGCPAGFYKDALGSSCNTCAAGTYTSASGQTFCYTCSPCNSLASTNQLCSGGNDNTSCSCLPGYTGDGYTCTGCNPGYYKSTCGSSNCLACGNGLYTSGMASTVCGTCGAGYYSSGSTTCAPCTTGTYSTAQSTSACILCQAGQYTTKIASTVCDSCPVGSYSTGTGIRTTCINCIPGTYSTAIGGTTCITCTSGQYSTASSAASSNTCQNCITGTYSTSIGAVASSTCQACTKGDYSTSTGATECSQCGTGFFSTSTGAASSGVCMSCAAGTYNTATTASFCNQCAIGTYSTTIGANVASVCLSCPMGTYQNLSSASVCITCATGKYSNVTGATTSSTCIVCKTCSIYSQAWTSCPAGSISDTVSCSCNSGYSGDGVTCLSCGAGYYNNQASSSCTKCPANTYSNTSGATVCLDCTVCDAHAFSILQCSPGSTVDNVSCTCNTGYTGNGKSCSICPAGTYGAGAGICQDCLQGFFSNTSGMSACLPCSTCDAHAAQIGFCYGADITDNTECICNAGYFGNGFACQTCTQGKYKDTVGSTCTDCPIDTYTNMTGSTACLSCSICDINANYTQKCLTASTSDNVVCACNAGYSGNGFSCQLCSAGFYKNIQGSTCTQCLSNTFSNTTGATFCYGCSTCDQKAVNLTYCSIGSTYDQITCSCNKGYSGDGFSCQKCSAGFYKNTQGSTCTQCPSNTFSNTTGATFCYWCKTCQSNAYYNQTCTPGSIQDTVTCMCAPGYELNASGVCDPCSTGYYNAKNNSKCIPCPVDTYSNTTATSACQACTTCGDQAIQVTRCLLGSILDVSLCMCNAGYYGDGIQCDQCPLGTYKGDSYSDCIPCPLYTYGNATGATACVECRNCSSVATYMSLCIPGSTEDTTQCNCNAGYSGDGWQCLACDPGYYKNTIYDDCQACPYGTFSAQSAATACSNCKNCSIHASTLSECTPGASQDMIQCICNSGYDMLNDSCVACIPGYYKDDPFATCAPCPSDTYSSTPASSNCSSCSKCSDNANSTRLCLQGSTYDATACVCNKGYHGNGFQCTGCPVGFYSNTAGVTACTKCPQGTFSNTTGASACINCQTCASNAKNTSYCMSGSTQDTMQCQCNDGYLGDGFECGACVKGRYMSFITQSCQLCPVNTYTPNDGMSACLACKTCSIHANVNSFCDSGSTTDNVTCSCNIGYSGNGFNCSACIPGYYKGLGDTTCIYCPRNYYANTSASSACRPCSTCDTHAAVNQECILGSPSDLVTCTCDPGYTGNGFQCTACSPGYYKLNSSGCLQCPVGTYNDIPAASVCKKCQVCHLNATTLTTCLQNSTKDTVSCKCNQGFEGDGFTCIPCRAGYFRTSDMLVCTACPDGTFSSTTSSMQCNQCTTCNTNAAYTQRCVSGATQDNTQCACKAGYEGNGLDCTVCNKGYFKATTGNTCLACPNGTFTSVTGATACVSCMTCSPYASFLTSCTNGAYNDTTQCTCNDGYVGNGFLCSVCPTGTYKFNSTMCAVCNIGSYQSLPAQTKCNTCSTGYYTDVPQQSVCQPCSPCSSNAAITQECSNTQNNRMCACNAGYAGTDGFTCTACVPGKYKVSSGNYPCLLCPLSQYQPSTAATQCLACSTGTYTTTTGATVCDTCTACDSNATQLQDCQNNNQDRICACNQGYQGNGYSCSICTAGTFKNNTSTCVQCVPGSYQPNTGQSSCILCPLGKFMDLYGSTACLDCSICDTHATPGGSCGITLGSTASSCSCNKGYTGNGALCTPCPNGQYKSLPGNQACSTCTAGTYTISTAATMCTTCDIGQYSITGSTVCLQCSSCSYFANLSVPCDGTANNALCLCKPGYGGNGFSCGPCRPGSFKYGWSNSDCFLCREGTYQPEYLQELCLHCPPATFAYVGYTDCKPCSPCSIHATKVQECSTIADDAICLCHAGYYGSGIYCNKCPVGKYKSTISGDSCTACPPGSYQNTTGATRCELCPYNTFSSTTGATQCQECNVCNLHAQYSPNNCGLFLGSTTSNCICDQGYTGDGITCTACATGTYKSSIGNQACITCSACSGSVVALEPCAAGSSYDNSVCVCAPGYYGNSNTCSACMPGTYSSSKQSSTCTLCAVGQYSSSIASTTCRTCPFSTLTGTSTCNAQLQIQVQFPDGTPVQQRILKQIHCSGTYQSVLLQAILTEPGKNPYNVIPIYTVSPASSVTFQYNSQTTKATPLTTGVFKIYATYMGVDFNVPDITVVTDSLLYENLYTPELFLYNYVGSSYTLSLYGNLPAYGTVDIIQEGILHVVIEPPPSVSLWYPTITLQRNSYTQEFIYFYLPMCNETIKSTSSGIIVNLVPLANDVDVGNSSGLFIQSGATLLPVYLNANSISAFYITFATDWIIHTCTVDTTTWNGLITCTINDHYIGDISIVAVGPVQSGTILTAVITYTATSDASNLEGHIAYYDQYNMLHTTSMVAGKYQTLKYATMPNLNKQTVVTLAQASTYYEQANLHQAEYIMRILANQQRYVSNIITYATDMEMTLLIQIQDLYGFYVTHGIQVYILLTGNEYPDIAYLNNVNGSLLAPYTQDGFWGVQYRQFFSNMSVQVSFNITTFDDLYATNIHRNFWYNASTLVLGTPPQPCPRYAHTDAFVSVQFVASSLPPQHVLACNLNVAPQRVNYQYNPTTQQYTVTIAVESILRSNDIRRALPDMYKQQQEYTYNPKGQYLPVPQNLYFSSKGTYEYLPQHAFTKNGYGFTCASGFTKEQDICVPVQNTWYWTILVLTLLFLAFWGFIIIVLVVCVDTFSTPKVDVSQETLGNQVEEEPLDDMSDILPIGVTEDGELEFEIESVTSDESLETPTSPRSPRM